MSVLFEISGTKLDEKVVEATSKRPFRDAIEAIYGIYAIHAPNFSFSLEWTTLPHKERLHKVAFMRRNRLR